MTPPPEPRAACFCGEPWTLGIVHRGDDPCWYPSDDQRPTWDQTRPAPPSSVPTEEPLEEVTIFSSAADIRKASKPKPWYGTPVPNEEPLSDVILDSPNFIPPQLEALKARGYKRINDPRHPPDEPLDAESEKLAEEIHDALCRERDCTAYDRTWRLLRDLVREVRQPVEQKRDALRRAYQMLAADLAPGGGPEQAYAAVVTLRARLADLEERGAKLAEALKHVLSWPLERVEHVAMARAALDGWAKRGT